MLNGETFHKIRLSETRVKIAKRSYNPLLLVSARLQAAPQPPFFMVSAKAAERHPVAVFYSLITNYKMHKFWIPSDQLQPFLEYLENVGLTIKGMPADLLHKQWLYFLGEAPSAPFYCQGWMMEDKMCSQQCEGCKLLASDRADKITEQKP